MSSAAGASGPGAARDSPYQGLIPYSEDDWPFFFGRSAEIRVIASNLRASRLTLLYGPSGVGKSSVLRAGVARHLRDIAEADAAIVRRLAAAGGGGDEEPARPELAVAVFRSWRDPPLATLMERIRRSARDALGEGDLPTWFPGTSVVETLRGWTERVHSLLIILDQFEDYFLYTPEGAPDGGFAAELARIVTTPDLRVNVLLSIREDALAKIDRFKGRVPGLYDNYLRIEHLGPEAAREAILEPVAEYNRRLPPGAEPVVVDDDLPAALLGSTDLKAGGTVIDRREVAPRPSATDAAGRVETSFLQLVMSRLWEAEAGQGSHALRTATLRRLGGPKAIIQGHLQKAMDALSPDERRIAARVFQFLVTPSKTKIAHTAADLAAWSETPEPQVTAVLERLCGGDRILRAVEPLPGSGAAAPRRYEIFHDVLADAVLDWRTRFTEHEKEAERAAAALAQAEAERRRVRRARLVILAVAALAALMALLAVLALNGRRDARDQRDAARSVRIASTARDVSGADPELGLLLALRALDTSPTAQAEQALRQTVNDDRLATTIEAGGGKPLRAAAVTPGPSRDARVITAGDAGTVRVWRADGGAPVATLAGSGPRINDAALSRDGSVVATGDVAGEVVVRDAASGEVRATLAASEKPVVAVAFFPDGERLAAGTADGTVVLWNWRTGRRLGVLGAPGDPKVLRTAVAPDGGTVAAALEDGRIRVWDAGSRAERPFAAGPHTGPANAVAFNPKGDRLASAGMDGTVRLYRMPRGRLLRTFRDHRDFVADVAFSPVGRLLVSAGGDGTILVEDTRAGRVLATLAGHDGAVRRVGFTADERQVVSAGADGTARVWNWTGDAVVIAAHPGGAARAVALSPDGATAVTLGSDGGAASGTAPRGEVRTWRWRTGGTGQSAVAIAPVGAPEDASELWGAAFADPDAVALAAGRSVVVASVADPQRQTALPWSPVAAESAAGVAASPDGRLVAATTDKGRLLLWRWPEGTADGAIPEGGGPAGTGRTRAAFLPGGDAIATADGTGHVRLWDVARRRMIREASLGGYLSDVAASPDGRLLATAGADGVATLLDARSLDAVGRVRGSTGPVKTVALGALGGRTLLATGGADGTVRVWDPATGDPLVTFRGQQGAVRDVTFTPDGRNVASVADDGSLVVWPCAVCGSIDEVRAAAGRLVTRELTDQEEAFYVADRPRVLAGAAAP